MTILTILVIASSSSSLALISLNMQSCFFCHMDSVEFIFGGMIKKNLPIIRADLRLDFSTVLAPTSRVAKVVITANASFIVCL